ncbi:protein of unknown function [Pararobbsia alpina]|uniref:hypothetical protein n=1 Tax=Pararobbsia alpina TaxID=621374 RepID=UPI0039A4A5CD
MTCIAREEFEAKIETIETRMDARVDRIEANSRETIAKMDARIERVEAHSRETVANIGACLQQFAAESRDAQTKLDARVQQTTNGLESLKEVIAERDKRLELTTDRAMKAAEHALTVKGHTWATAIAVTVTIVGSILGTKVSSLIFDDAGAKSASSEVRHSSTVAKSVDSLQPAE